MSDRRRYPTWKWISGILMLIVFAAAGTISTIAAYSYQETQKEIKELKDTKVDKEMFAIMQDDVREIKSVTKELNTVLSDFNATLTSHVIESGKGVVTKKGKVVHK